MGRTAGSGLWGGGGAVEGMGGNIPKPRCRQMRYPMVPLLNR